MTTPRFERTTREDFDTWLAEFEVRRRDINTLLRSHHRDNRFGVALHANGRAADMVEDGLRMAWALMIEAREKAT